MALSSSALNALIRENAQENELCRLIHKAAEELITKKHANELIGGKYISENDETHEYRVRQFAPIIAGAFSRVTATLSRIGRPRDFIVNWPEPPARLPPRDNLQTYCNTAVAHYGNLRSWLFECFLPVFLEDPNGVCAVVPANPALTLRPNEYLPLKLRLFHSEDVLNYIPGVRCVLVASRGEYIGQRIAGDSTPVIVKGEPLALWVMEGGSVQYYVKGNEGNYDAVGGAYAYPGGVLPAFRIGLTPYAADKMDVYRSELAGALIHWKEATLLYSDLQGALKSSGYPLTWFYEAQNCTTCRGKGIITAKGKEDSTCSKCNGTGGATANVYSALVVKAPVDTNMAVTSPIPPGGYIERDRESILGLEDSYKRAERSGYAAINMEFLSETPAAQSGVAKEFDRAELNSFLGRVARHLAFNVYREVASLFANWRYAAAGYSTAEIAAMLPTVSVSERFDVVPIEVQQSQLTGLKAAGLSPEIVSDMETGLIKAYFADNPAGLARALAKQRYRPFPGVIGDDLSLMLMNGGISRVDYVINGNIGPFIERAFSENPNFGLLDYMAGRAVLEKYAAELPVEQAAEPTDAAFTGVDDPNLADEPAA